MINQKVNFENPEKEIKCEFGEASLWDVFV